MALQRNLATLLPGQFLTKSKIASEYGQNYGSEAEYQLREGQADYGGWQDLDKDWVILNRQFKQNQRTRPDYWRGMSSHRY